MPAIKIDGRAVDYKEGDTVIRAAHRVGIDIPHYCWHPGLSIAANCRMCLVEVLPPPGRAAMQLDVLKWDAEKKDYVVDRKPKLQPACQQACAPDMEVLSDQSPHVAQARAAVQELLLLNHPVDCPICDQAGECRLQDYWLEHGRKQKRMTQEPVHKPKGVVFGPTIVYDAERCIVCTRCVRVSEELAKDPVLSVRERGNLNEIVVSPGRELDHNYTLMTEHVCPVGALTSKDFRFKARVWFLRSSRTVCQGCATGCNAYLDYDPRNNTAYRHRPRENEQVNKYWMCDEGMLSYQWIYERRLLKARVTGEDVSGGDAIAAVKQQFGTHSVSTQRVAVVLSAEHSLEDNFVLSVLAKTFLGATELFVSGKPLGKGDGILMSDDKNPNTRGVMQVAAPLPPRPVGELVKAIEDGRYDYAICLGSSLEIDETTARNAFSRLKGSVAISAHKGPLSGLCQVALPAAVWAETDGTTVNRQGLAQRSEAALTPQGDARPAWRWVVDVAQALGYALDFKNLAAVRTAITPPVGAPEARP